MDIPSDAAFMEAERIQQQADPLTVPTRQLARLFKRVMRKALKRKLLAPLSKPYPPGTPPRAERRRLQRAAVKKQQPKIKGVNKC
jgi:hypothetical protein